MDRYHHGIGIGIQVPDGYVDGGRGMGIHGNGRVTSYREIIVVDREKDARLRDLLAFARSDEMMSRKPLDRALTIARRIVNVMSKQGGR
jgi:hypothetical protein